MKNCMSKRTRTEGIMKKNNPYQAVVIGTSAGGLDALSCLLSLLPADLPLAIIVICHRAHQSDGFLTDYLRGISAMPVSDVENLNQIVSNHIYIAPPGYHVLIDEDYCFNLTVDPPVNGSRPSIDVTFECAATIFSKQLIGVVLTGANSDGADGLAKIKQQGGYTIVQDPITAEADYMPKAAIAKTTVDYCASLNNIAEHLSHLASVGRVNYD
jgi:two-component system, chemotaxis family, protein-glutamate methylesterase/glutaminase